MMKYSDARKDLMRGNAAVIARDWLHIRRNNKVLIVTTTSHADEIEIMQQAFRRFSSEVEIMIQEEQDKSSVYFDVHENIFNGYDMVVGATKYSIITTKAVKNLISKGGKFLSFPCSTNDGRSILEYSFLRMDTQKSKFMAKIIKSYIDHAESICVSTERGTNLQFFKRGREPGFFNGEIRTNKGFSSSSIELYIPIEETETEGTMYVDGSLGYIGRVDEPFLLKIHQGRIADIEETKDGRRLIDYIDSFGDENMRVAGELGIGLNSLSCCCGNCYIEDESAYGTFHIGFGRNLALGGIQEACGHFDIVSMYPDIFADNRQLMSKGRIIVPVPQVY